MKDMGKRYVIGEWIIRGSLKTVQVFQNPILKQFICKEELEQQGAVESDTPCGRLPTC
jgi:hypothetical protein